MSSVSTESVAELAEEALGHFYGIQWTPADRLTAELFARALLGLEITAPQLQEYSVNANRRYGLGSGREEVGFGSFGLGLLPDPADPRTPSRLCIQANVGGRRAGDWVIWHDDQGRIVSQRTGIASPGRPEDEAPELLRVLVATVINGGVVAPAPKLHQNGARAHIEPGHRST